MKPSERMRRIIKSAISIMALKDEMLQCANEVTQLETELERVKQRSRSLETTPLLDNYKALEAENERLQGLLARGHFMDESRTWFWDDDIVEALGGDG